MEIKIEVHGNKAFIQTPKQKAWFDRDCIKWNAVFYISGVSKDKKQMKNTSLTINSIYFHNRGNTKYVSVHVAETIIQHPNTWNFIENKSNQNESPFNYLACHTIRSKQNIDY